MPIRRSGLTQHQQQVEEAREAAQSMPSGPTDIDALVQSQYGPGATLFELPGAPSGPVALEAEEYEAYQNYLAVADDSDDLATYAQIDDNATNQLLEVTKAQLLAWSNESGGDVVLDDQSMLRILQSSGDMTFPEFVRGVAELNMAVYENRLVEQWEELSHSEKLAEWSSWRGEHGKYNRQVILASGATVPFEGDGLGGALGRGLQRAWHYAKKSPAGVAAAAATVGPVKGVLTGLQMAAHLGTSMQVGARLQNPDIWNTDEQGRVAGDDDILNLNTGLTPTGMVSSVLGTARDILPGQAAERAGFVQDTLSASMNELQRTLKAGMQVWRWKEYYDAGGGYADGSDGVFLPDVEQRLRDQSGLDEEGWGMVKGISTYLESKAVNEAIGAGDNQLMQTLWLQAVDQFLVEEFPGSDFEAQQHRAFAQAALGRNELAAQAGLGLAAHGRISSGRSVASEMGLVPGDPYYDMVSGVNDATHQMIFDPLIVGGKARGVVVGMRHALKATDNVANTGRVLSMLRRPLTARMVDDVARTVGDDAVRQININLRGATEQIPINAGADEITEATRKAMSTGAPADEKFAGFERIMRAHPRWAESYQPAKQFIQQEILNQIKANAAHHTDDVLYGRKFVDADSPDAMGHFTSLGNETVADGVRTQGTLVNGVSRSVEVVPMMRKNAEGVWELADDFVTNETLNAWMVSEQGFAAMRGGKLGGMYPKFQTVPFETVLSLPMKNLKQAAARAIDYMSESPTRYARSLVKEGHLSEEAMNSLGLQTRHGITRGIAPARTTKDGTVVHSLRSHLIEQGMDPVEATKKGLEYARRSTFMNPMSLTGRALRMFSRNAIRGGIEFGKGNNLARFRDFVSLAPSDVAARLSNEFARATTDAEQIFVIRGAIAEMLDIGGAHTSSWADDFRARAMQVFDEVNGIRSQQYVPFSGKGQALDEITVPGTGQTIRVGLGEGHLAGGAALPDMRLMLRYMQRGSWTDDPLGATVDNDFIDMLMGKIWNPSVLYRLSFPLRASGDEIGVAALRDNPFDFLLARLSWSAAESRDILPRFLRGDKTLARARIRRKASYEQLAEAFSDRLDGAIADDRLKMIVREIDTLIGRQKDGKAWRRLTNRTGKQTSSEQAAEEAARARLRDAGELENAARLRTMLDDFVKNDNPYDTLARLSADEAFSYWQHIMPLVEQGRATAKALTDPIRKALSREVLRVRANQLHALQASAGRSVPKTSDMLASPQRNNLYNPSETDIATSARGNQRLDDPLNRSKMLESQGMENLVREAGGDPSDPRFVAAWRDNMDLLLRMPEFQAALDQYLDNLVNLVNRRDVSPERLRELLADSVEKYLRSPEVNNGRYGIEGSVGGRKTIPDWQHDLLRRSFGGDDATGTNRGGAGPRRPDGNTPSPDGFALRLGDDNDVAFHAELAREKELIQSEIGDTLALLGIEDVELTDLPVDELDDTARELLERLDYIEGFERGDVTADELFDVLVGPDQRRGLHRMDDGKYSTASPPHRDRAWRVAVDPSRTLMDQYFDPQDTDAFFRAVGLSEHETGFAPVLGASRPTRWADIPAEYRPDGVRLSDEADIDAVIDEFVDAHPNVFEAMAERVAQNRDRVLAMLDEGELSPEVQRINEAFSSIYASGYRPDDLAVLDDVNRFLSDLYAEANQNLRNVYGKQGHPVADPRNLGGWLDIERATQAFFGKHLGVMLPPGEDYFLRVLAQTDGAVGRVVDNLADYQAIFDDASVMDIRHVWEVLTEQLRAQQFRAGSDATRLDITGYDHYNDLLLEEMQVMTAKVNERLGLQPGDFALTPIHMAALDTVMMQSRFLEAAGSPDLDLNQLIELLRGGSLLDQMRGSQYPGRVDGLRDLVDMANAQVDIVTFRRDMAAKESEVFRWAVRPDRQGVEIGIAKQMATVDEIAEIMADLADESGDIAGAMDEFFANDELLERLGHDPDEIHQGMDRAQDAWLEMFDDGEYLETLTDTRELRGLYDVEPVTVDSLRHSIDSLDDEQFEAVQRVIWERLGTDPSDLAALDEGDLVRLVDDLANDADLTPAIATEVGTFLKARHHHHFDVRVRSAIDKDRMYPDAVENALTATLFHGSPGHPQEFLPLPEHIELLQDYLRYKRHRVKTGMYDESINNSSNHAFAVDRRWYHQASEEDIADDIGDLFDPDAGQGVGGGEGVVPPRSFDEGFKGGSDSSRTVSVFATESEGIRQHADRVAAAFMENFLSDPQDQADAFAKGLVPPREGMEYYRVTVGDDGLVERLDRIATSDAAAVDYDTLLLEAGADDPVDVVGMSVADVKASLLGRDAAMFGRPIATEDLQAVEANVEAAVKEMFEVGKANGMVVTPDDEFDLQGILEVHRQLRDTNPQEAQQLLEQFVGFVETKIVGDSDPDEVTQRVLSAFRRLVDDGGHDSQRIIRSIGDEDNLLGQIHTRIKNPTHRGPLATVDELSDIRPAFMPKQTHIRGFSVVDKKPSEKWGEFVQRNYEPLLAMIDTVAREPMILHYYSDAAQRFEDELIEAARGAVPGQSLRVRQARNLENSRLVTKAGPGEKWAASRTLREDIARYRAEGSATTAEDAAKMDEDYGRVLIRFRGPNLEVNRALHSYKEPTWLKRAVEEDPALRTVIEEVFPRHFLSASEVSGASLDKMLMDFVNDLDAVEQMIHDAAMTDAYAKMSQLTDNDAVSSQFAMKYRNLFPFWWAEERFVKRLATTMYYSPETAQQWHLTYKGITSYGVIEEDDNGEQIFVYPFGRAVGTALNSTVGRLFGSGHWQLPVKSRVTGRYEWAAPSISSQGFPLLGPAAAIPIKTLMRRFPEHELLQSVGDKLLPEMSEDPNMRIVDTIVPTTLRRAYLATFAPEEERVARYGSQLFNTALLMKRAGLVPSEQEMIDDPDKAQEYQNRLRNQSRVFALQEMFYSFVGPSPARVDVPDNRYQREFRELTTTYGFGEGAAEFIKRHPDITPITMFSTESVSGGPLPATEESLDFMRRHRGFLTQHSKAAYLFFPDPPEDMTQTEYHTRAYMEQRAMGLRVLRNEGTEHSDLIGSFLNDIDYQAAASSYYDMKDRHRRELEAVKGTGLSTDLQRKHELEIDSFQLAHPNFAALNKAKSAQEYDLEVNAVRAALNDPDLPRNSETDAVEQMVALFDEWKSIRDGIGVYGRRLEPGAALDRERERIVRDGFQLALDNPNVARIFWERTIVPAMGWDRTEALHHANVPTIGEFVTNFDKEPTS